VTGSRSGGERELAERFLRELRRRWRLRLLLRGGGTALATGAGAALLLLGADAAGVLPPSLRPVLLALVPALSLLTALPALLRAFPGPSRDRLALLARERDPRLEWVIPTLLELPDGGGMAGAFARSAGEAVAEASPARLVPLGAGRPAGIAGVALALLVAAALLSPGGAGELLARWTGGDRPAPPEGALEGAEFVGGEGPGEPTLPWASLAFRVEPPPYTGLPGHRAQDDSQLRVLPGSRLTAEGSGWRLPPSESFRVSRLRTDGIPEALLEEGEAGGGWRVTWTVGFGDRGLLLETGGAQGDPTALRVVPVLPLEDLPPTVELLEPDRDHLLSGPGGSVRVRAEARDDHGVADLRLRWVHTRGSGESWDFREGELPWEGLSQVEGGLRGEGLLELDVLEVRPGDVIHLRAVAVDRNDVTGPGEGVSGARVLRVAGPDELHEITLVSGFPVEGEREPVLSQRMIILLTEALLGEEPAISSQDLLHRSLRIAGEQQRLREEVGEQVYIRATGAMQPSTLHLGYQERVEDPALPHTHGYPTPRLPSELLPEELDRRLAQEERRSASQHGLPDDPAVRGGRSRPGPLRDDGPEGHRHDADPILAVNRELRAVHDLMWEAERALRQGAPGPSLPYQYRALEELQRIREAERVFARGSSRPPPVDVEGVRGTGPVDDARPAERDAGDPLEAGGPRWAGRLEALAQVVTELDRGVAATRISAAAAELLQGAPGEGEAATLVARAAAAVGEGRSDEARRLLLQAGALLSPLPPGGGASSPRGPGSGAEAAYARRVGEMGEAAGASPPGRGTEVRGSAASSMEPFVFATVRYRSGNWDSAPLVPANLIHSLAQYTDVPVDPEGVVVDLESPELFRYPFLFLTGHIPVHFTEAEARNLRLYLERGGFLFVDDHNHDIDGAFHRTFVAEVARILGPDALQPLPNHHPLYRSFFEFPDGPPTTSHELNGWGDGLIHPVLHAVLVGGRIGLLYSNKDYASEWNYHAVNKRFLSVDNTRFGVNVLVHALTR